MKKESKFPFAQGRQVRPEENKKFTEALTEQFGINLRKRDRPIKSNPS